MSNQALRYYLIALRVGDTYRASERNPGTTTTVAQGVELRDRTDADRRIPGGGIVVYRLSDGPFAGKYVYMAEHITVSVRTGQTVRPGQQIATLYEGYPWVEVGWAAGPGPEALAMADGHRCPCGDPGDWSTIDGRDFDHLLVTLGAPSGILQANPPTQSMPRGWPNWSG